MNKAEADTLTGTIHNLLLDKKLMRQSLQTLRDYFLETTQLIPSHAAMAAGIQAVLDEVDGI